jgi:hypothetical protein
VLIAAMKTPVAHQLWLSKSQAKRNDHQRHRRGASEHQLIREAHAQGE